MSLLNTIERLYYQYYYNLDTTQYNPSSGNLFYDTLCTLYAHLGEEQAKINSDSCISLRCMISRMRESHKGLNGFKISSGQNYAELLAKIDKKRKRIDERLDSIEARSSLSEILSMVKYRARSLQDEGDRVCRIIREELSTEIH